MLGLTTIQLMHAQRAEAARTLSANDPGANRMRAETRRLDEFDSRPGDDVRPGSRGDIYPCVLRRLECDGDLVGYHVLYGGEVVDRGLTYDSAYRRAQLVCRRIEAQRNLQRILAARADL